MRLSSLAALALVGLMATGAFAQPGGAGGRGGRGGGFGGGFGGMGRSQSAFAVAANSAVQKELSLTEDQIAKMKTLGDEARGELQQGGGGFEGLRDLPEDERRAKMTELMAKQAENARKVAEKYKPKIAEVLDAKQVERLDQIVLQAAGSQAYTDPAVVKALGLSKDQQDKVAAVNKEYGDKLRELGGGFGGGGGGGEDRGAKMRELGSTRDKDLAAVLTADQSSKLEKMKGKEFDVAQLRGGFGGPGGGRPGGAGGGGSAGGNGGGSAGGRGGRPNAEGRPQRQPQ